MNQAILAINAGSSSIKFSLFTNHSDIKLIYRGEIENIYETPCFVVFDSAQKQILKQNISKTGFEPAIHALFDWIQALTTQFQLKAVGHRVVHGGMYFTQPTIVDDSAISKMALLNPLAPLHQPYDLEVIKIIRARYPKLLQVACFDTDFHQTQNKLAKLFAIPRALTEQGIIRYGFHGISYEYIALIMQNILGEVAQKRVIAAHLGNGASLCAMQQAQSVATSMGLTALDGLMMGTRCGAIDPGVLLYLLQQKQYSAKQLEHLLYLESGLLGVSQISSDMRDLLNSQDPKAKEAIDLFCYRAACEIGALTIALQGCDALIFTGGIGENSALIRQKICDQLQCFGVEINSSENQNNAAIISNQNSSIVVAVIPTNEEYVIAKHTKNIIISLD